MCCINIHLNVYLFTFNPFYCTWLLHTVRIKRCTTKCSGTTCTCLLMFSHVHRTVLKFNNEKNVVKYDTNNNAINDIAIFQDVRCSIYTLIIWFNNPNNIKSDFDLLRHLLFYWGIWFYTKYFIGILVEYNILLGLCLKLLYLIKGFASILNTSYGICLKP